jgi:hypothetical protein
MLGLDNKSLDRKRVKKKKQQFFKPVRALAGKGVNCVCVVVGRGSVALRG